jgi:hypothetical protein
LPCYSPYYWPDVIVQYNLFLILYTLHLIQILIGTLLITSKICCFPVCFITSTDHITATSHTLLNTDNFCQWQCDVLVVKKALVKTVHPKKVSHQYNYFKLHWSYLHFSERRAVGWYILTTDVLIFRIPQIRKYIYVITIIIHVIRHYYYYYCCYILCLWHYDACIGLGQHTAWWLYNGS